MARRVRSSKENSIEAEIKMLGAEKTRLVTQGKRDENYLSTLADLEKRIAEKREALDQAKGDDFND